MKKTLALMLAAMLLVTGCGQAAGGTSAVGDSKEQSAAESQTAQTGDETQEAAKEDASQPAAEENEAAGETDSARNAGDESAQMANPWIETETMEEAAAGAGIDGLELVENLTLGAGEELNRTCRYMEGITEVTVEYPAVLLTIRKGTASEDGDISGDYNTYAHTWTQNIKGLNVNCFGNREGDAAKTIWTMGDNSYSITAAGLGGDTDYGLSADDINTIVNGLQ